MTTYRHTTSSDSDCDQTRLVLRRLGIPFVVTGKLADGHDVDVFMDRPNPRPRDADKFFVWFIEVNTNEDRR